MNEKKKKIRRPKPYLVALGALCLVGLACQNVTLPAVQEAIETATRPAGPGQLSPIQAGGQIATIAGANPDKTQDIVNIATAVGALAALGLGAYNTKQIKAKKS